MNVVIAGGGTGGHLFPGMAIAQEFMKRDIRTRILFLGASHGIEARVLPAAGFTLKTLWVRGVVGKSLLQKCTALAVVPVSCLQAAWYIKAVHADLVLGVGGYSSFPAVIAARLIGIPTAIHEQNTIPGFANRVLGVIADRVFVSFEESKAFFPRTKTLLTGLPVRQGFGPQGLPNSDYFCLMVCGGSQGARPLNMAMVDALPLLGDVADRLYVLHQAGSADCDMLRQRYAASHIRAEVEVFVHDMASWYRRAHVVLCRAGASTLAELALCGKASVLVPYPFAAGNHQERNAQVFAREGACELLPQERLSGKTLAALLRTLIQNPDRCAQMGANALKLARPRAAADIVEACFGMAKKA